VSEPTHSQLLERIAKLETFAETLKDDIGEIKDDVKALTKKADMGAGALWLLFKIAAVIAALGAAGAWVMDKVAK
jgi:hypothetical protein